MKPRGLILVGVGLVVMGVALGGLLAVSNNERIEVVERRAVQAGEQAAKEEVQEQVAGDIKSEVTDQLDERLLTPSTLRPVPSDVPDELLPVEPATTTTLEGPFNLTTTTTETPPTTTTTIIEVPTTVTIPEVPLP